MVQVPTGEKEYATICEPCGRRGELGKSHMNGVAGRRVEHSKVGRGETGGGEGRGGESCVSRVEVLCSKAGVTSKLLDACNRPAAFCEVNSRRKRSTKREKHFVTVGGRFWPQKEEGLTWRSSLPRRRGRRIPSGRRRRRKEGKRERKGGRREGVDGAMECNCKRVEVGEVMEERQVVWDSFSLNSFVQIALCRKQIVILLR